MESKELYNQYGQVEDPEIAQDMAETEKSHREKKRIFGLMGPSKSEIQKGINEAEYVGKSKLEVKREMALEKEKKDLQDEKASKKIKNFALLETGDGVRFELAEHVLEARGIIVLSFPSEIYHFYPSKITIDGISLSGKQSDLFNDEFGLYIAGKIHENKAALDTLSKKANQEKVRYEEAQKLLEEALR